MRLPRLFGSQALTLRNQNKEPLENQVFHRAEITKGIGLEVIRPVTQLLHCLEQDNIIGKVISRKPRKCRQKQEDNQEKKQDGRH